MMITMIVIALFFRRPKGFLIPNNEIKVENL